MRCSLLTPVFTIQFSLQTLQIPARDCAVQQLAMDFFFQCCQLETRGLGTPILGHTRDVQPEWVTFPGRKPADGCKFLTKNLRMGHNFDIIYLGMGDFPLN